MNRWRALLVLAAILALVNLVGVAVLREAWSARHQKAAHPERPAARVQPIDVTSGPELFIVHKGKRRAVRGPSGRSTDMKPEAHQDAGPHR